MTQDQRGIFWMVIYSLCFAVTGIAIRLLSHSPYELHPFQLVFFGQAIALCFLFPWVKKHDLSALKASNHRFLNIRILTYLASLITWFYALSLVPINNAVALSFVTPLITTLLAVFFLHERIKWRRTLALIIGFIGTLIVLRPGSTLFDPHMLLVLLASLLWSICNITAKKLTNTHSVFVMALYQSIVITVLCLPALFLYPLPSSAILWVLLGVLGLVTALSDLTLFKSFYHAHVSVVMPFGFLRLIITTVFAYFLLGEIIDGWTLIGSLVIFTSTLYILKRSKKDASFSTS